MARCEIKRATGSCRVNGTNHCMVCTICDRNLGILVESDEKSKIFNRITKYRCICLCGGDTFVVRSENECYFVPDQLLVIKEMKVDTENVNYITNDIILGIEK